MTTWRYFAVRGDVSSKYHDGSEASARAQALAHARSQASPVELFRTDAGGGETYVGKLRPCYGASERIGR